MFLRWGDDLGADEEKLLLQHTARRSSSNSSSSNGSSSPSRPRGLVVVDHPRSVKPFYMRVNEKGDSGSSSSSSSAESGGDGNAGDTVASMDVLLPGVGEVLGGSLREERLNMLLE